MLLNRIPLYFLMGACLVTVYSLFHIKDKVTTLKAELKEVKKQVELERDTMRILKAELAYLTSPDRLQRLVKNYLNLKTTEIPIRKRLIKVLVTGKKSEGFSEKLVLGWSGGVYDLLILPRNSLPGNASNLRKPNSATAVPFNETIIPFFHSDFISMTLNVSDQVYGILS